MQAVLNRVEQSGLATTHVLERFHPSYYALQPEWSLYSAVDVSLGRLRFAS